MKGGEQRRTCCACTQGLQKEEGALQGAPAMSMEPEEVFERVAIGRGLAHQPNQGQTLLRVPGGAGSCPWCQIPLRALTPTCSYSRSPLAHGQGPTVVISRWGNRMRRGGNRAVAVAGIGAAEGGSWDTGPGRGLEGSCMALPPALIHPSPAQPSAPPSPA